MALPISILKNVLDFKCMHIKKAEIISVKVHQYGEVFEQKRIIVNARPFKRTQCRCPICNEVCPCDGFKQEEESTWRAPNLNGVPVFIKYKPQRILCKKHGALNEFIPWADGTSRFTAAFNDEVAWLVCQMSKTAICELEGINWRTVGNCVKASHSRLEPNVADRLHDDVRRICVDETSYKKGYKYITVVYDMDKNRVIWVHENHGLSVFEEFCQLLSPEERNKIEVVAGDGASWIDSCMEYFPNATRCIDFFHVVQWATEALDRIRINTASKAKRDYEKLKDEFTCAEAELVQAAKNAEQEYRDAIVELAAMPRRGRRSKRKKELQAFIHEYETINSSESDQPPAKRIGRPPKEQFSPEHEAALKELLTRVDDIKNAKLALGHNPENCTERQVEKLRLIENTYPDLYRAYQLKESLRLILHMKDPEQASFELAGWKDQARQSGLKPMQELADKIERHEENIINSIKCQANSAKSESTNTTIKSLIHLARGFRNMDNMIALIYLKCSDIVIPLHNRPRPTKEYLARKRARANELRRLREERRILERIA